MPLPLQSVAAVVPVGIPQIEQGTASSPLVSPSVEEIKKSSVWAVLQGMSHEELLAYGLTEDDLPVIAKELRRQTSIEITASKRLMAYLNPSLLRNGPIVNVVSADQDFLASIPFTEDEIRNFLVKGLNEYSQRKDIPWRFAKNIQEANINIRIGIATGSIHPGREAGEADAYNQKDAASPLIGPYFAMNGKDVIIGIFAYWERKDLYSIPLSSGRKLVSELTAKFLVHELTHLEGQIEHTNWETEDDPVASSDEKSDGDIMESGLRSYPRKREDVTIMPWTFFITGDSGVEYAVNLSDGDPLNDPSNLLTRAMRALVMRKGF